MLEYLDGISIGKDRAHCKDNDLALLIDGEALVVVALIDPHIGGEVIALGQDGRQVDVEAVDHEDLVLEQGADLVGAGHLLVPDADEAVLDRLLLEHLRGVPGRAECVHGDDASGLIAQEIVRQIAHQCGRCMRRHHLRVTDNRLGLALRQLGLRAHVVGMIVDLRVERLHAPDQQLVEHFAHALLDEHRGHRVLAERILQRAQQMVPGAVQISPIEHNQHAGRLPLAFRRLRLAAGRRCPRYGWNGHLDS